VERFLDTQVKHYSSGMYVRLAFAVAAHLDPEILIVDEVLAVGDAQFQKKCLGKMNEVARDSGRTVLFVSHNTSALQAICRTGICLQQGRVVNSGSMSDCLSAYLGSGAQTVVFSKGTSSKPGITSVTINPVALTEGDLRVEVGFTSPFPLAPMVGVILYNRHGQPLMGANGRMAGDNWRPTPALSGVVIAQLKQLPLHSDSYRLSVWLGDAGMNYDEKRDVVEFDFVSHRFHPQAPPVEVMGPIDLPWQWSIKPGE
jgi:lipopolysaccharide transport system ATP-binding protein